MTNLNVSGMAPMNGPEDKLPKGDETKNEKTEFLNSVYSKMTNETIKKLDKDGDGTINTLEQKDFIEKEVAKSSNMSGIKEKLLEYNINLDLILQKTVKGIDITSISENIKAVQDKLVNNINSVRQEINKELEKAGGGSINQIASGKPDDAHVEDGTSVAESKPDGAAEDN